MRKYECIGPQHEGEIEDGVYCSFGICTVFVQWWESSVTLDIPQMINVNLNFLRPYLGRGKLFVCVCLCVCVCVCVCIHMSKWV